MAKLTVLGIGNILMRDDGVGVRLMEAVRAGRDWPADVEFVDGGAGGMNLLTVLERAERLVVFDAADLGLPPGETRVLTADELDDEGGAGSLSLHEMPFARTLDLCRRFLRGPAEVIIMAIQPADVGHGRELSERLRAAMGRLTAAGGELVERALA